MTKLYLDGTLCFESKEKICKISVILTEDNYFERIILTPLCKNSPFEDSSKPLYESFAAKIIENCFMERNDKIKHLPFAKTDFSKIVFEKLLCVPSSETISYSELAALCGSKNAARAVGNAMRNNPLPIIYPCHRVIGKNGFGGGFCGKGKDFLEIKERFLFAEKNKERISVQILF
jgi:O-6-methylguanine DNA methyltransferase